MKKLTLIFLLAFSCSTFAQTIRRCNNNPGVSGVNVYTTIQAAHDAAVAGDIIYVEPSGLSYGAFNCSKRLTIIGNGYMLSANTNTPFEKQISRVDNVAFNSGSALSQIIGVTTTGVGISDLSITISRCYISSNGVGIGSSANNCVIKDCIITTSISSSTSLNATITGNIIFQPEQWAVTGVTNGIITNNLIYSEVTGYFGSGTPLPAPIQNVGNCTISNNIFDFRNAGINAQAIGCSNTPCSTTNTVSNNICLTRNGLPPGNGNVNGADATTTFQMTNPWSGYTIYNKNFTQDAIFQLATSSPAKGIGTGGTDAGAFGGANPYILSGLPAYPVMTNFTTTGVGNTTTPLQVNVTVRGNN